MIVRRLKDCNIDQDIVQLDYNIKDPEIRNKYIVMDLDKEEKSSYRQEVRKLFPISVLEKDPVIWPNYNSLILPIFVFPDEITEQDYQDIVHFYNNIVREYDKLYWWYDMVGIEGAIGYSWYWRIMSLYIDARMGFKTIERLYLDIIEKYFNTITEPIYLKDEFKRIEFN
jgi:hypothetical protein